MAKPSSQTKSHAIPRITKRMYRALAASAIIVLLAGVAAGLQYQPAPKPAPTSAPKPAATLTAPTPAVPAAITPGTDSIYYGTKTAPTKAPGTIRLVAYNIENLFDDVDDPQISGNIDDKTMTKPLETRRAAANAIKELNADVIAFQEIESKEALEWFREQHLKGLGYDYIASLDAGDGRGIEQSVLSRFPIKAVKNWVGTELDAVRPAMERGRPDPRAGEKMKFARSPIFVEIEIPSDKTLGTTTTSTTAAAAANIAATPYVLSLIVLHHKSGRDFNQQREAEARKVVEFYNELIKEQPLRNIAILGDFNAAPDANSIKSYTSAGLIDAFAARVSEGNTFTKPWITHASNRVIDFIFISPQLAPEVVEGSAFVLGTPTRAPGTDYRKTPEPAGAASDHMPIAIDITPKDAAPVTAPAAAKVPTPAMSK